MKRFLIGFLTGDLLLVLFVVAYLRFGLANVAADAPTPAWETRWMFSSAHASIRRTVPHDLKSPIPTSDETLIAGGKLYLNDCVGCHGAPGKPPSDFGATFYPPTPVSPRRDDIFRARNLLGRQARRPENRNVRARLFLLG